MLRPGEKTQPLRQTASLLVAPFEGTGYSLVDGKRFDWKQFDTLAVPGGAWCEHVNGSDQRAGGPVRRERRAGAEGVRAATRNGAARATATWCASSDRARAAIRGSRLHSTLTECPRASCVEHQADRAYRLPRRRPGLGRRHHALCRPHAQAERHDASYDIADPQKPEACSRMSTMPEGWHSHKVRAQNGIMIVNHEKLGPGGPARLRRRARRSTTCRSRPRRS